MLHTILTVYAPIAVLVFLAGTSAKVLRHAWLMVTRRRPHGGPAKVLDPEPLLSWPEAIKRAVFHPILKFPRRSNPVWTWGVSLYHIGVVTTVLGYAITGAILIAHRMAGDPVPDVMTGALDSYNYSLVNLVTLVFANGEPAVARFLFGGFGPVFVVITWLDVLCAATGNLLMIAVRARKLSGAVVRDLDSVTRGVRVTGRRRPINIVVTAVITAIIWTEILGRLQLVPGIVGVHAVFGLTLMLLFPFSYLWHMAYVWVAFAYAAARRRRLALA